MTTNNTYTPYSAMQSKLEQLRDFRGSSATAVFTGRRYIVKSYDTLMLDLDTKTGELLLTTVITAEQHRNYRT